MVTSGEVVHQACMKCINSFSVVSMSGGADGALACAQGGPLGMLPGHMANHLQRAGAPPRPHEGNCTLNAV